MQAKLLSTGRILSFLVIMLSARILAQGSFSYEDALDRGAALMQASRYELAIRAYKEAARFSQGDSTVCQLGLAMAYNGIGASKNAAKAARKVIVASTDPEILAMANNQLGVAVFSGARGRKGPLAEAERAFRQALKLSEDEITIAAYNLGLVLLQLNRDSEGLSVFGHFLELEPEG
ncbi:MAG: tetratricopeptide repeat protein, partial [Acidobacteriota bacterium]